MRSKKVPSRTQGMEGERTGLTVVTKGIATTNTPGNTSTVLRGGVAQLGRACVPGRGPAFKKETRSVGMSTVPADPKDMETQKAQEKLRHIESLGIIKIEKDESPGPRFLIVAPQQQGQVSTVLELQSQATTVSGVVDVPILTNMEGEYGFTVSIQDRERTTKSPMWLMSKITKKLYTNINKAVPFEINLKKRVINEHFFIRAVPVFSSPQFLRTNVNRCPNHASPTDPTNHGE
ncbi:p53 protein [Penaeus vannamei]|uniref:p53 protein n=1 Tax=Penaeus vannamei TaxID=6689 RepID=A0A3R7ME20_PENVA|nr:p53 protein [Penaeus vannamei]